MPIIKSAKKKVKQDEKRTSRLRPFKTRMLTMFKNIFKWAAEGNAEKMQEQLSATYKAIDMAAKKNIIEKNNASRRKSAVQKAVNKIMKDAPEKVATPATKKAAPTKKAAAPKAAPKAKDSAAKKASVKKAATKKAAPKKAAK